MKTINAYIYPILLFIVPSIAFAHSNEAEELGHHWENPIYIKEIWLQALMIIIICSAYILLTSIIKSWKESRKSNEK